VRVLIGYDRDNQALEVNYLWSVTGSAAHTASGQTGEFFTFTPTEGGTWDISVTVTGRNFIDDTTISETAQTQVICDPVSPASPGGAFDLKNFSPGQFTEGGTGHGWSLGTVGGYWAWTVNHNDWYTIEGNAFEGWTEPGVVWFQEDLNGNNLPDEMWYEVNAGTGPLVSRGYSVTFFKSGGAGAVNGYGQIIRDIYWADGKGRTGKIPGGWPREWGVPNTDGAWVTYTATLLGDEGEINGPTAGFKVPTDGGPYVDHGPPQIPISRAIAADHSAVKLTKVRFVKVQNAVFAYGSVFGEVSTEITNRREGYHE
jgi:hypothetical protein